MSDITKCIDVKCPSREQCYRYTAKVSPRQYYGDFNRPEDADKCESFWKIYQSLADDFKAP
jgi:hypothetical protein